MKLKQVFAVTLIMLFVLPVLSGCAKYSEDDIIGFTSSEIVEKYGDFDRKRGTPDEDGLYRDCDCGYLISEKKVGFLGTTPPEYFMIYFDENGVADWCDYEQVV